MRFLHPCVYAAVLLGLGWPLSIWEPSARAHPTPSAAARGPWGSLHSIEIVLDAPEEAFSPSALIPRPVQWHFPHRTWPEVQTLLQRVGLSTAQVAAVQSVEETPDGVVLAPPAAWIRGLSRDQRALLYAQLAAVPENTHHYAPFRYHADNGAGWFDALRPYPELYSTLQALIYRRGEIELFSDPDLALAEARTPALRRAVLESLYRTPTILARLEVKADDDPEALAAYWGAHGRRDDVLPLIEAVQRDGHGWELPLSVLLPPFARSHLYTFDTQPGAPFRDCHWTSLNFFNQREDDRFMDPAFVKRTLLDDYRRIPKAEHLGDLLLFRNQEEQIIHSCVYIADHLVFTKNGGESAQAWTMMHLDDVRAYYTINGPLETIVMRIRD